MIIDNRDTIACIYSLSPDSIPEFTITKILSSVEDNDTDEMHDIMEDLKDYIDDFLEESDSRDYDIDSMAIARECELLMDFLNNLE